jgi:hypothetical protein
VNRDEIPVNNRTCLVSIGGNEDDDVMIDVYSAPGLVILELVPRITAPA